MEREGEERERGGEGRRMGPLGGGRGVSLGGGDGDAGGAAYHGVMLGGMGAERGNSISGRLATRKRRPRCLRERSLRVVSCAPGRCWVTWDWTERRWESNQAAQMRARRTRRMLEGIWWRGTGKGKGAPMLMLGRGQFCLDGRDGKRTRDTSTAPRRSVAAA